MSAARAEIDIGATGTDRRGNATQPEIDSDARQQLNGASEAKTHQLPQVFVYNLR